MKPVFFISFFTALYLNNLNAQVILYQTVDGIQMTEENYLQNKKELNDREDLKGKYQEIFIKKENRNDTVIYVIKFEKINFLLGVGNKKGWYDPYSESRKMIGTHFPIELFKDEQGNDFSMKHLKGKPSIVNFWFTNCPPCIEEIPDLIKLKKEYGTTVNFIAITFESKKNVNKFLAKRPFFDFIHITDSQKSINKLKIESYPLTFLLNAEGEIVNIYGALKFSLSENLKQLLNLLLEPNP